MDNLLLSDEEIKQVNRSVLEEHGLRGRRINATGLG